MAYTPNAFIVFGANTNVGKTCISAGLAFACQQNHIPFYYVKPLQTGATSLAETDAAAVATCADVKACVETLYSWLPAVSPHLANKEGVTASDILKRVEEFLNKIPNQGQSIALVETAGGPASPATTEVLQVGLYRHLNLPAVLVGDAQLGGISATITAYSYLVASGYQVEAIVFFDAELKNHESMPMAEVTCPVLIVPPFEKGEALQQWARRSVDSLGSLAQKLLRSAEKRAQQASASIATAKEKVWWPFTQHQTASDIRYIDAAYGDYFYTPAGKQFDAVGSWWTMGFPHGDLKLAQVVGAAAARYGHVLFPEHIHAPALELAERLLATAGKGWAQKVFYSDNGSTAVEVALKMAFRLRESVCKTRCDWRVIGLADSYHGDTLGAMDASSPNVFKQSEAWYKPRGVWLQPPTLSYQNGVLGTHDLHGDVTFASLAEVFSDERLGSELAKTYLNTIESTLNSKGQECGALLIEPVVHGSGGMLLVDPLFQRLLIRWCRAQNIPVIFDEVFVGLWRLGVPSASILLNETPDIACYAKLLTGGVLPLAATLATHEVFQCFLGDSKAEALLHGHSFTAHPSGCAAGAYALKTYQNHFLQARSSDYWEEDLVAAFSKLEFVKRAVAIGSICAVEFQFSSPKQTAGYLSDDLREFIKSARQQGFGFRPLGNVIYFVVSPFKTKAECRALFLEFKNLCERFFK